MLHRHYDRTNESGLISWFEAGSPLEGDPALNPILGIAAIEENLALLTSGGRSKSPTHILESDAFGQLLEKLKKHYDLVIVDSPPLGAVTDALLIAERVDEVVYVCRFNRALRKHIRLYIKALRAGKNEVLGIVLNGLTPRRIEYYSNYRYYRSSRVSGSKLLHANNLKSGSGAAIESKTVMSFINNSLIVTFSNGVTLTT
jgi:Mrp family chromosome partitioning ATPase